MLTFLDEDNNPHAIVPIYMDTVLIPVACIIDTGFNGDILLTQKFSKYFTPIEDCFKTYQTATGALQKHQLYTGTVGVDGIKRTSSFIFTKSSHNLIGIHFLQGYKLTLDLKNYTVDIT